MAELRERAERLAADLEERGQRHAKEVARLRAEARELQQQLRTELDRHGARQLEVTAPPDDALVRRVEWRLDNCSSRVQQTPRNEAIWSEAFSVMGVSGLQLEFFPQGRDSTSLPGFCALFLWCPAGVRITYQLWVGSHRSAPDEDEYTARMGHGHSNFCLLEAQRDPETDSLRLGIDILGFRYVESVEPSLQVITEAPEAAIAREARLLHSRYADCVEWRIRDVARRARELPRGLAICSPTFSIAGIREMLLEFYPNGIAQTAGEAKEGYCGFYMRCPSGTSVVVTLFVGSIRKGPIRTEFDGNTGKGLPEFCRLSEQIREGESDLIVGVVVQNPQLDLEEGPGRTLHL